MFSVVSYPSKQGKVWFKEAVNLVWYRKGTWLLIIAALLLASYILNYTSSSIFDKELQEVLGQDGYLFFSNFFSYSLGYLPSIPIWFVVRGYYEKLHDLPLSSRDEEIFPDLLIRVGGVIALSFIAFFLLSFLVYLVSVFGMKAFGMQELLLGEQYSSVLGGFNAFFQDLQMLNVASRDNSVMDLMGYIVLLILYALIFSIFSAWVVYAMQLTLFGKMQVVDSLRTSWKGVAENIFPIILSNVILGSLLALIFLGFILFVLLVLSLEGTHSVLTYFILLLFLLGIFSTVLFFTAMFFSVAYVQWRDIFRHDMSERQQNLGLFSR